MNSRFSILIVDDSEELLDVLSLVLKQQGHRIFVKTNPYLISRFVRENKIDLLLLDVFFGEDRKADGREVCKNLKSDPLTNYFPIILMSVFYDNLIEFKYCEADGVIEKPFDLNELMQKINTYVHTEPTN